VFTKHQVYYCCNEMECCESVDDAMSFGPSSRSIGSDDTPGVRESYALKDPLLCEKSLGSTYSDKLRVYEGLINNYMPRRLTRDSDALYAISGLLGYLQKDLFPNGFFYGLPMADFPQSMLWHQGDRDDSLQNSFHLALKGTHGRVSAQLPSWSWVGWRLPLKILIPRLGKDEDQVMSVLPPFSVRTGRGKCLYSNLANFNIVGKPQESLEESTLQMIEPTLSTIRSMYGRVVAKALMQTEGHVHQKAGAAIATSGFRVFSFAYSAG
jgi:hypothetical protein